MEPIRAQVHAPAADIDRVTTIVTAGRSAPTDHGRARAPRRADATTRALTDRWLVDSRASPGRPTRCRCGPRRTVRPAGRHRVRAVHGRSARRPPREPGQRRRRPVRAAGTRWTRPCVMAALGLRRARPRHLARRVACRSPGRPRSCSRPSSRRSSRAGRDIRTAVVPGVPWTTAPRSSADTVPGDGSQLPPLVVELALDRAQVGARAVVAVGPSSPVLHRRRPGQRLGLLDAATTHVAGAHGCTLPVK